MKHDITHDDLVRYVDGELDDDKARAVEAAIAADPALRSTVRSLAEGATLLRAAFNEPVHGAGMDALATRVAAALAEARGEARSKVVVLAGRRRWLVPAAVAASVAVIALGLGGGYFVAGARLDSERATLASLRLEDHKAFELAVQDALEKQVSGKSISWQNPSSGHGGTVTPIRTFKSADGQWCREYAYESQSEAGTETLRAVACRAGEGRWETRIPVFVGS